MKKELIFGLALAPAIVMAGTAMTGSTTITANACSLLQDDLRVQLSTNVVGGYTCDTATNNAIYLATCHTSGRTASRTSTVSVPSGCGGTSTVLCTGTAASTVTGAVVPSASTLGGSMAMNFPGGTCDTGGAKAATQTP